MKEENAPVLKLSGKMREIPLNSSGQADFDAIADAIMNERLPKGVKSYFTTGPAHAGGSGYWIVQAGDHVLAREKMWTYFGPKWAFQYTERSDFTEEKCHGVIL